MLERGETPPGIRDDINDKPPNPEQPPPPALMKPLPKPWEQQQQPLENSLAATPTTTQHFIENIDDGDGDENRGGAIDLSPVVPDDVLQRPSSGGAAVYSRSPSATGQRRPGSGMNASPLTAAAVGSKGAGAASIFEAATSSQGSPGVIAGRLSPSSEQQGRRGAGVATPTSLFNDALDGNNGDGRPPPVMTTTPPIFPDEGGLGRPTSRGWRPPPIPVPTLSPENMNRGGDGGGVSGSVASGSQNSLGADFTAS